MSLRKSNIWLYTAILFVIVLFVLPVSGKAQIVSDIYKNRFNNNLAELKMREAFKVKEEKFVSGFRKDNSQVT